MTDSQTTDSAGVGSLDIEERDEMTAIVRLVGEIDLAAVERAGPALKNRPQYRFVVIEVARITFLDSTGVGLLVSMAKAARQRSGGAALVGMQPRVEKLLRIAGLSPLFTTADSIEAALQSLQAHSG
ncbi:MAG TPA: STAS domain-containing protein [Candidatus Xenobia bacterium]